MAQIEEAASHTQLEWDTPLFRTAIAQFEQAVPYADISEGVAERLRYPERAVMLSVPVRLDDERRVVFAGYRVQHSSVLGPTKGGIRYDTEVDARRVRGAGRLDDLEMRAAQASLRRREGRRRAATRARCRRSSSSG